MKKLNTATIVCILLLVWCNNESCFARKQPVKIIFDTDMLTDPEDVNALCLLHAFADAGEAEILACVANGHEHYRASGAVIDVVNTFYHRPGIPVGTYKGNYTNKRSTYTFVLRDKFPHDAPDDDALPNALDIYRQTLSRQPDNSVTIVSVGFLLNLHDLLESKPDKVCEMDGKELVRKKVRELVVMGGKYPEGREYNFYFGGVASSAKYVTEHWPDEIPVIFSGYEIGERIISGKKYKTQLPECPLRSALENAYDAINQGRESWDETAVIYAVRGSSYQGREYWKLQSEGSVFIDCCDGSNKWISSPDRNQYYLIESMPPDSLAAMMEEFILKSINNALKK
ncbi:MAG: nucleoside hydrolase [Bacteroidales bacterium]|jgi:inosine-uridine nucleoside N-ribohydrolase|nr:nucleoside hydrolase [Bacteroidales bacterium]